MIGEIVSHYRIIESLGEGAMGRVYLAEDINLARQVAIKFLSSTSPEYRDRFLREARAVSRLSHANIATVYDYGETDRDHGATAKGTPFIVMEYIPGETLSHRLLGGSLPLPEAVRIVSAIAAALAEAHHQHIVHRDIKPSNVVITGRGQPKVLDFGLVKQIHPDLAELTEGKTPTIPGALTRSDVIVGTPLYLSPEQATGKDVDGRSDLFALGAVLYECLTGQSAFSGSNAMEIGAQVIYVTPPVPSSKNPHVPPELDRITMKALEKKAEKRYQTAEELSADLHAVLPQLNEDGFRVGARSTGALAASRTHSASALRTFTDAVRRPRLSVVGFVISLGVLVLLAAGIYQLVKPKPYQPNAAAAEWYTKGVDALRNGALVQATKSFQQSISLDENYALAHARMADADFELDYSERAKDEMLRVRQLAPNVSQLARSDGLLIEAIDKTVTRKFPDAIEAYKQLLKESPDDAQLYVDLGRAYEKNDDVKRAIETYVEATSRLPQYAPAFLRLGVLYGEKLDLPSATANFDKAQSLFEAAGNFEGQAEVAFHRGTLFDKLNKYDEARPHLDRALELSRTTGNQYVEIRALLKLGNVSVGEGNYDKGRELINHAIEMARANGVDNQVKRGLVDLGNTYMSSTDYPEAEKYFRQSLQLSQEQKDQRNAARAALALGGALQRQSKTDEAIRYIEQALAFYRQAGYRKEEQQGLMLLARTQVNKGDYAPAIELYNRHKALGQQLGDPTLELPSTGDLGLLFTALGRYPEAIKYLDDYYAIAKSSNSKKEIGLGQINRAAALWPMGRYDEAKRALDEVAPMVTQDSAAKNLAAGYYLVAAKMALSQQNWAEAKTNSRRAIELAGTQLKATASEANFTLCLAQISSGDKAAAAANCEKGLAIAIETHNPGTLCDAMIAGAQSMDQLGNSAAAVKFANEAVELSSRLGKQHHEWIAWLLIAKHNRDASQRQPAMDAASRASSILNALQQQWGSEVYNGYLKRNDIDIYRKQLDQVLSP